MTLSQKSRDTIDEFLARTRRDKIRMLRAKHWRDPVATFHRVYRRGAL